MFSLLIHGKVEVFPELFGLDFVVVPGAGGKRVQGLSADEGHPGVFEASRLEEAVHVELRELEGALVHALLLHVDHRGLAGGGRPNMPGDVSYGEGSELLKAEDQDAAVGLRGLL